MEGTAAVRRDRLLHCHAGDLMTEPQPAAITDEQPGREDLIEDRRRASRDRLDQAQIAAGADQCRGVQHVAGLAAQPADARQHGVACRRRDLAHPSLEHFCDVERVSAGQPVQRGRIKPACTGQAPHRVRGQGRKLDTPRRPLPDQLTKSRTQGVTWGQVLAAVGDEEQNGGVRQPPAKEPQQVNGRLIGPVDVLHDHHVQRSPFADLAQALEQLKPVSTSALSDSSRGKSRL